MRSVLAVLLFVLVELVLYLAHPEPSPSPNVCRPPWCVVVEAA